MKKDKKHIAGIVLTVIGAIGLLGLFSDTEDKLSLFVGSALCLGIGIVLIRSSASRKRKETNSAQVETVAVKEQPQPKSQSNPYNFHLVKVVGVTFKNEDGTNRQSILRKIKWYGPPFESGHTHLSLEPYEFAGEPAVGVYVDGIQIGNLSKEEAKFFISNRDKIEDIVDFEVVGGGTTDYGEKRSYGAHFYLKMRN